MSRSLQVPNAPGNEGYKVACNADGSGTISFCSDRTCGSCSINSPFSSEVCLPNPPRYGEHEHTAEFELVQSRLMSMSTASTMLRLTA